MTTDLTGGAVTATTEPPQIPETTTPEAVKQPDPNAKRWAHMAKQEKMLRQREAKFKAEQAAFEAERTEARVAREWKQKLSNKNFDVLAEAGLTQDDLTAYLVNQPNPHDRLIGELKAEIAALRGGQDEMKKGLEEQTTRQYKDALTAISNEGRASVQADPEKFELCNANLDDAVEAATTLVEELWKTTGRIIPVEEALNEVEEYYLDTFSQMYEKSTKIKAKIKPQDAPTRLPPPSPSKTPFSTAVREAAQQRPSPRTLTHQQIPAVSRPLSARDRVVAHIEELRKQSKS